jgi:hypothetical protein
MKTPTLTCEQQEGDVVNDDLGALLDAREASRHVTFCCSLQHCFDESEA